MARPRVKDLINYLQHHGIITAEAWAGYMNLSNCDAAIVNLRYYEAKGVIQRCGVENHCIQYELNPDYKTPITQQVTAIHVYSDVQEDVAYIFKVIKNDERFLKEFKLSAINLLDEAAAIASQFGVDNDAIYSINPKGVALKMF